MSAIGTKRTSPSALHMSASDPKRTSGAKLELVANYLLIPETASDTTPST
jgi:hypothetical protein